MERVEEKSRERPLREPSPVPPSPAPPVAPPSAPRAWRSWCALVLLSGQRQARAHLMVWIALALLALTTLVVAWENSQGRWSYVVLNSRLDYAGGFLLYSRHVVLGLFCGFLLPMWSLSFATEALGREREAHNLIWVLSRPLSRPAIYLAKFVALLPWVLGFNLGGFALVCLVAGPTGRLALALNWPAVAAASLAYAALFHLMGAWFRRSAVVAVLYSFFLESFMGSMPGYWKRCSISFYTRCLVFAEGGQYGVQPRNVTSYIPVEAATAWGVLAGAAVLLLLWGLIVFSRSEYLDLR